MYLVYFSTISNIQYQSLLNFNPKRKFKLANLMGPQVLLKQYSYVNGGWECFIAHHYFPFPAFWKKNQQNIRFKLTWRLDTSTGLWYTHAGCTLSSPFCLLAIKHPPLSTMLAAQTGRLPGHWFYLIPPHPPPPLPPTSVVEGENKANTDTRRFSPLNRYMHLHQKED